MRSHTRTYNFTEATTFKFAPEFCFCDSDILPKNGMIETMDLNVLIEKEEEGIYSLSISLPSDVICDGDMGNPITFWGESGLSKEQIESDIEQMIERKELFI